MSIWIDFNSMRSLFKEMRNYPVLSKDKELEYFRKYHEDDLPKHQKEHIKSLIIKSNFKWAFALSKTFVCDGFGQDDMFMEAVEAMIKCFDDFDYTKNVRFASYATFPIKNQLNSFIYGEGKTINDISSNKTIDNFIKKTIGILSVDGVRPSDNDIINKFNEIKPDNVAKLTLNILHDRLTSSSKVTSFDTNFKSDEEDNSYNIKRTFISYENADYQLNNKELKMILIDKLSQILTDREKLIIMYTFGLMDDLEYTPEMIAARVNLTRERVGQIQTEALNKLKEHKELLVELV